MINAIAIDDEPRALQIIEALSAKLRIIQLNRTFTQVSSAKRYINTFPVDLIFLDIQMPDQSGIDFYRTIEKEVMVIFTTAYDEFALDGFELNAVDYLLKPISLPRFKLACERANDLYQLKSDGLNSEDQFLSIRSEYALINIKMSDIVYLESLGDYVKIHRVGEEPVTTLSTLSGIVEKIPECDFIRVHRSFVVNKKLISAVRSKTIYLNSIEIPIGSSYSKKIKGMLK